MATPCGRSPTGIVATTVSVLPLITDTVPAIALATYTLPVRGLAATASGRSPTGMIFETLTPGLAAWAARDAEDADAATAGASAAIAVAISITARWMGFIISAPLIRPPPPGRSPHQACAAAPVCAPSGRIGRITRATKARLSNYAPACANVAGLKSRQAQALRQHQQALAHPRLSNPLRADRPVTLGIVRSPADILAPSDLPFSLRHGRG